MRLCLPPSRREVADDKSPQRQATKLVPAEILMNINEHPIYKDIYDLCLEIEKLPASEQATKVVVMAVNLNKPAAALIERNRQLERELSEFKAALTALLVGQEFDGGGHLVKRVAPSHSSIIKAKMLLEKEDGK